MRGVVRVLGWLLAALVVLAAILRLTLFDSWTIPDNPFLAASLEPTLSGGDTVLVLTTGESSFGDLVRCADPENAGNRVVGRLAGMPGDAVEVKGQMLTVNGKPYVSTEACSEALFKVRHPDTGDEVEMRCDRVEMGSGWHYRGYRAKPAAVAQRDYDKRVGPDNVLLLSDNRDIHEDSRDFGTVPLSSCDGRIVFRLWSKEGWGDSKKRLTVIR